MPTKKQEIITFKVDEGLARTLECIPNRSEFIRTALLAYLSGICPLCNGTGVLSPHLKLHWKEFLKDHEIKECKECHALFPVCSAKA
jgi:hypothetical protein